MDNNHNNNPKNKKTAIILTATLLLVFVVGVFWLANADQNETQASSPTAVNEQKLIGPPSFEQLSAIIDEILLNAN